MAEEQAEQTPAIEAERVVAPEEMSAEQLLEAVNEIEGGEYEEPAEELAPAEQAPAAEEQPAEEVAAGSEVTEEAEPPSEIEMLREEMRLRSEKDKAERERWEYLAQNREGELNQLRQANRSAEQAPADPYDEPAARDIQSQVREAVRHETEPFRQNAVQQAAAAELNEIQQRRPDFAEYADVVSQSVQTRLPEIQDAMESGNPKYVKVVVRSVLEGSYADARIARMDALREQSKQRRADQSAKLVEEKRAMAVGGSSSTPTPLTPKSPKAPSDMTNEELEAEIRAIERSPG